MRRESSRGSKVKNSDSAQRRAFVLGIPALLGFLSAACGRPRFKGNGVAGKVNDSGKSEETPSKPNQENSSFSTPKSENAAKSEPVVPCLEGSSSTIETAEIPAELFSSGTEGHKNLKIWGRRDNALVAFILPPDVPVGSSVMLSVPKSATAQGLVDDGHDSDESAVVLASKLVMHQEIDVVALSSMIIFENISFEFLSQRNPNLIVVISGPNGYSKQLVFENVIGSHHEKSKRYAFLFKNKPVVDIQVSFLPDEDALLSSLEKSNYSKADSVPVFGGDANGFGHARNSFEAIVAENLRTAGYQSSSATPNVNPSETAHITHALTQWSFPQKFKSAGTVITNLLEKDLTSEFSQGTTNYLKNEYCYVIYKPNDAVNPTVYYRYMVQLG
jgi:hypothetical protein